MAAILKFDKEKITEFLRANNAKRWFISSSAERGANAKIWESDPEIGFEPNIDNMFSVLETIESGTLYIHGCDANNAKNNYDACFRICNTVETKIAGTPAAPVAPIGYVAPDEMRRQIDEAVANAVAREQFKAEKERFEMERKEFKTEQKEFQQAREGVIGLLVEKAAPVILPYIQKMSGRATAPAMVAGLDPDDYQAPKADPEQDSDETFTDEEAERLLELCERWKKADAHGYIALLEKIVTFAESGAPISVMGFSMSYDKIKEMLLHI